MKIRTLISLISCLSILIGIPIRLFAQLETYGNVIPPSPRSTEFEKFVNYKVSLSNGLPEIGINFYTVEVDNMKIPIGISYHASGIKYNQSSGDVGLGWGLTSAYRVSRKVYGRVDEIYAKPDMDNISSGLPIIAYLNSLPTQYDRDLYLARFVNPREQAYVTALQSNYMDGEFDIFTVGLPSQNGNFIITDRVNKVVTMLNNSALKLNYTTGTAGIDGFSVTDPDGVKYQMGQNEANSENLQISSGGVMKKYSTGWMISNITTPLNNSVSFQYVPFQETRPGITSYSRTITEGAFGYDHVENSGLFGCYSTVDGNQTSISSSSAYNTSLLSVINGLNETVTMNRNTNGTISDIVIRRKDNALIKKVVFYYSQYGGRIFLDLVHVEDSNGAVQQKYKFDYNSKELAYNYYDNFGYHQNDNLLGYAPHIGDIYYYAGDCPTVETNLTIAGSHREDYVTSNIYMLKKITYPTGGSVSYYYEPNKYKAEGSANVINGGGMRISSIESNDGPGLAILKRYYTYGSDGSGKLLFNLNDPSLHVKEVVLPVADNGTTSGLNLLRRRSINTNLDGDLADSYVQDNMGWYNNVRESFDEGYIDHLFTMPSDYLDIPTFFINTNYNYNGANRAVGFPNHYVHGYHFWNKPVISERNIYERKLGVTSIKKKETFSYFFPNPAGVNNEYKGLKVSAFALASGSPGNLSSLPTAYSDMGINSVFNYDPYIITSGDVLLKTKTVYDYDISAAAVETKYEYNYTVGNFISEEKITDSKNELLITKYKYPSNFLGITATDSLSSGIKQLQTLDIISSVIEKSVFRSNINGTGNRLVEAIFTAYKPTQPLPDKIFDIQIGSPLLGFTPANVLSGEVKKDLAYKEIINIDAYNSSGKILSVSRPAGLKTSYKWGYNDQYPIAEIKNASLNEFYHQNFEENTGGFDGDVALDNTRPHTGKNSLKIVNPNTGEKVSHCTVATPVVLTVPRKFVFSGWVYSDAPSVQLFLFMMKPGETSYFSYVDSQQITTTGKWTFIQKVTEVPADVTNVFLRLDNNSAGTVWFDDLRIQPADASMSTYTYQPLVGMTSAIDDRGKTVYYEYDSFQRLKNIKDQNNNIVKSFDYHFKQ
jgi:hypothetical protein